LTLFLLSSLILNSCGGSADTTDTTASSEPIETTTAADPAKVCDLPAKDWGGEEFHVLGYENTQHAQFSNFEIWVESENGEVVNDAIYRRNTAVEDRYNVKIVQTLIPGTDVVSSTLTDMRSLALSGDDLYDLAFCGVSTIGSAAREALFYDLNTMEYLDFSKEWWNPEVNNRLEVQGRLFFTNSDFSLRDKNRAYILAFNKSLMEEYKLPDCFEAVHNGTWTLDMMRENCMAVANDVNGDGQVDYYDMFGLVLDSTNSYSALAISAGVETLANKDGSYELVINDEHTVNVIDKVLSILSEDRVSSACNDWEGETLPFDSIWSFSGKVFNEGRALYTITFPHGLAGLSANCTDDYGIIPFPKYDEAQKDYTSLVNNYAMLMGIPASTSTPEFSAFMLEALSAESYTTSLPAYIEVSCKTKYTYDEDSAAMLDLIFDNLYYDTAIIYNISGVNTILNDVLKTKKNGFASKYASVEKRALTGLEKLVEDILAVE